MPLPRLDFYHSPPQLRALTLEVAITSSGVIHGICSWFDLWLSDRLTITTHPDRTLLGTVGAIAGGACASDSRRTKANQRNP